MTIVMSPAATKAQVYTVAGSQPYVLGWPKGISSWSEEKLGNLRKLCGRIKKDPGRWKGHFSVGKIHILRKSEFFPCLQAEENPATTKSLFLSYAKRQKKRLFLSSKKKVKFKHSHKGKIIPFKVICSRISLSSYPLSLMYLTLCKSVSNPTLSQKNPLHPDACPALTPYSACSSELGVLIHFKCELFGGITLFRQHKSWVFTSVLWWKYG